jgi:hypothetical protein
MGEARTPQSPGSCAPRPPLPTSTSPEDLGPGRPDVSCPLTPGQVSPVRPGQAEALRDSAQAGPVGLLTQTTKGRAEVAQMWAA